jgi:hypothetical protein
MMLDYIHNCEHTYTHTHHIHAQLITAAYELLMCDMCDMWNTGICDV